MRARADVPLKVGEVAKLLGWPTRKARRWIDGLERQDQSIVVRVNGQRHVTLAALRRVCPEIAAHYATQLDVDELRDEQETVSSEVRQVAASVAKFRRDSNEWFKKLDRRVSSLEKKQGAGAS